MPLSVFSSYLLGICLLSIVLRSFISRVVFGQLDVYVISAIVLFLINIAGITEGIRNNKSKFFWFLKINLIILTACTIVTIKYIGFEVVEIVRILIIGLTPFLIFLLIKMDVASIKLILLIISFIISLTTIYDFNGLNIHLGSVTYEDIMQQYFYMRPKYDMVAHGLTKSMNYIRPLGALGIVPHNSALANGMFTVYWAVYMLTNERVSPIYYFVIFISSLALWMSLVASTITAVVLVLALIIFFIYRYESISFKNITLISILISFIYFFEKNYFDALWLRLSYSTGDWDSILDFRTGNFANDIASFLFGNYRYFSSRMGTLEISLIALIFQYSIFWFILFIGFGFYPIIFLYKNRFSPNFKAFIPEVAAISVGMLSLWHYSSLFDTENFVLFIIFYSSFIAKLIKDRHNSFFLS